jgi:hypothetical protein
MKSSRHQILETLEQRILHGLSSEWETALRRLQSDLRNMIHKPMFCLYDYKNRLGCWSPDKREIGFSRHFVLNHSWDDIREVLYHEMAHQVTTEAFRAGLEPAHGPSFQKACRMLRANPKASGTYIPLSRQILQTAESESDKIRLRIQKLLALAQSSNLNEAESAMIKAHELMAKYEIDQISRNVSRDYFSVFVGKPALRHFAEDYSLAHLLIDFYFVRGLWISAYVIEKEKMGKVLEISGTARNIQIAVYVFDFISRFVDAEWNRYNTDNQLNRYRKTDFATGILSGFRTKLEDESIVGHDVCRDRSLVKSRDSQLTQYFSQRYPRIKTFSRKGGLSHPDVISDGVEIGKKLVIRQGISQQGSEGSPRLIGYRHSEK